MAHVTESVEGGDAGDVNTMKSMMKENRKQFLKKIEEVQVELKEVRGEVRAVQQTPSTVIAQPTSLGSRDEYSGGYQQYNSYSSYGPGGSRGRGTRGGWRGRGVTRSSQDGFIFGRCFLCGGRGHSRDYCCGEEVPGAVCFGCGGNGHLRYNCPSKQREIGYNAGRGRGGSGRGNRGGYRGGGRGDRKPDETSDPAETGEQKGN